MGTVNQNVEQVSKFCSMLQVYNTMYTITAPRQNIVSRTMHYYWFRPLVTFSACTDVIHFFLWQIWDISNSKSGVNHKLLIFLDEKRRFILQTLCTFLFKGPPLPIVQSDLKFVKIFTRPNFRV